MRTHPNRTIVPYPGHEALCDAAVAYIKSQPDHPILIFTGPIGSGRSRLADAVLERLADSSYQRIASTGSSTDFAADEIRTVGGLFQLLAKQLPVPQLITFLNEHAGWLGADQVDDLRLIVRQRRELIGAGEPAVQLRQQLNGIVHTPRSDIQMDRLIDRIAAAISILLHECDARLALAIDLTYATGMLRRLTRLLAERVDPPLALLLVVDSQQTDALAGLRLGQNLSVPPLSPDQLARLAGQHKLALTDQEAIERLHNLSDGRPEIAEFILDELYLSAPLSADAAAILMADNSLVQLPGNPYRDMVRSPERQLVPLRRR